MVLKDILIREGKTIAVALVSFVVGFFTRDFLEKKKDRKDK